MSDDTSNDRLRSALRNHPDIIAQGKLDRLASSLSQNASSASERSTEPAAQGSAIKQKTKAELEIEAGRAAVARAAQRQVRQFHEVTQSVQTALIDAKANSPSATAPREQRRSNDGVNETIPSNSANRANVVTFPLKSDASIPPKPDYLQPIFDNMPDALKALPNWVCWRAETPKSGDSKWRKVPYIAKTGTPNAASTTEPKTWRLFTLAVAAYEESQGWQRPYDGIGFVFDGTIGDDGLCYCGFDWDEWTEKGIAQYEKLNTYSEVSASGRGGHAIARAKPFGSATYKRGAALDVEAYSTKRYFACTGHRYEGSPPAVEARTSEVAEVLNEIYAQSSSKQHHGKDTEQIPPFIKRHIRAATEAEQLDESLSLEKEMFDNLGGGIDEPLNIDKFKDALWALPDEWIANEINHFRLTRVCANEAKAAGGAAATIEELWTLLDERSKVCDRYNSAENRDRYDRCLSDYGKEFSPLTARSLYWWAKDYGWNESAWTMRSRQGLADADGGGTGAGPAGSGTAWRGAPKSQGKSSGLLKGRATYAQACNMLYSLSLKAGNTFAYDQMHDRNLYGDDDITDHALAVFREYCINNSDDHRDFPLKTIREATDFLCSRNPFDPEQEWLTSLQWDGIKRIDVLFTCYCGADDTELNRAIGRKLMIGKVMRALFPGCPHDWAPVLEAPQGWGKTSFTRILAGSPDRVLDAPIMHEDTRKQQEMLLGITVHEIAEMSDFKRADLGAIKLFMSRTHDRARKAYAHSPTLQPRRCISIGTIDRTEYLLDEENRRFPPIKVNTISLDEFKQDRNQLHAEAVVAVLNGETSILPEHLRAEAAIEQKKRRVPDTWEDEIIGALSDEIEKVTKDLAGAQSNFDRIKNPTPPQRKKHDGAIAAIHKHALVREIYHKGRQVRFLSSKDLLGRILGVEANQQKGFEGQRVKKVMERLGWTCTRIKAVELGKKPLRGYTREVADGLFDKDYLAVFESDDFSPAVEKEPTTDSCDLDGDTIPDPDAEVDPRSSSDADFNLNSDDNNSR
jgi:Virulence-associated protein E